MEKIVQSLQLDKASDLQKYQMEMTRLEQQIMKLENDLRNCQKLYNQQGQVSRVNTVIPLATLK